VYFDRKTRRFLSTGEKIHQDQWDEKNSRIKPLDKLLIDKQSRLTDMLNGIETYELELIRRDQVLTPARLEEFMNRSGDGTFNAFIENELKSEKVLKYGTTKGHWVMLRKLNEFSPGIKFHEINYDLVHRFDQFLHTKDLGTNTIADHHKVLRRYISWP